MKDIVENENNRQAAGSENEPSAFPRSQSLDGLWKVKQDPGGTSDWEGTDGFPADGSDIRVPGNLWEISSMIQYNDYVWYSRTFTPEVMRAPGMRHYLKFDAVQYYSDVYLNGVWLGSHEGAQTPFEFDVTDHLAHGPNRLTVRAKNSAAADGDPVTMSMGAGITQHVTLMARPAVRIKDVFAKPDIDTGRIVLLVTMENGTGAPAEAVLHAEVREAGAKNGAGASGTRPVYVPGRTADGAPSEAVYAITVQVPDWKLWSVDHPNLYTVSLTSSLSEAPSAEAKLDEYAFRIGFRDFRVSDDGFFLLNGQRFYMKSTHGNIYEPVVIQNTSDYAKFRSELASLKEAGFNTFRTIAYSPLKEQLELADELGMMIYAEHQGSWIAKLNPAKFPLALADMVKAFQNHPSLVIWGLLNETHNGVVFEAARDYLPAFRTIDDTRLVLLSSGRWDMFPPGDPEGANARTGSASNPGSDTWNVYWGGEDPVAPRLTDRITDTIHRGYMNGAGDIHIYQTWPNTQRFYKEMEDLAQSTKPVFVSEAGMGAAFNPIAEQRKLRQAGADPGCYSSTVFVDKMVDGLVHTWDKYRLYDVYPDIEQFPLESQRLMVRQREIMFNVIRGNPQIMSYNLTGLNDAWGYGEGIIDNFGEFKPGLKEILQAGWSRLRWSLFVNPGAENTYTDQPFQVKVSLANDRVLAPGTYSAVLTIANSQGEVWTHTVSAFEVSGNLVDPVYTGTIAPDQFSRPLTEGTYTLTAALSGGVVPASGQMRFHVTDRNNHKDFAGARVTVLGTSEAIGRLLRDRGADVKPYDPAETVDREVIVVGDQAGDILNGAAAWRALYRKVAGGAHAVFLDPAVLSGDTVSMDGTNSPNIANKWIPLTVKGTQRQNEAMGVDWLYHKEYIAMESPVFDGAQGPGVMDSEYYSGIMVRAKYFSGIELPDETAAVSVYCTFGKVIDGVAIGTYRFRGGRFTINAFSIVNQAGTPAADRLLLNMAYMASRSAAPSRPVEVSDDEWDALGIK